MNGGCQGRGRVAEEQGVTVSWEQNFVWHDEKILEELDIGGSCTTL